MRYSPLWLCALSLVCAGCSDDADGAAAPTPEPTGPPAPSDYLAPAAYDCSASGAPAAPARPHAATCFSDASCSSQLVVGHRMATPFAPENSLSALRAAILLGVDIVETDVRLTADGEIVILHDRSVDRTFEGSGDINTLTLAEAQSLTMHANPSLGGDFSCERLPTLAELMAIAAGRIVVELEVKESDAGVAAATYLRDNDLYASAFLLCDPSECAALRLAVPDAPIMTRPESANEVATETQYDPAPIMVHIDAYDDFLTDEVIDLIHGVGAKVYANAFLAADVEALSSGNLEPYLALYGGGLDVAQTELPHYALTALGRLSPTR